MTTDSEPNPTPVTQAAGELARLEVQVEAMRTVLVRLLQDVVVAESRLAATDAAKIVEVNEQLVVTAMAAQADADTAAMALQDAQAANTLDALTRLPNRSMLATAYQRATANARRHDTRVALLFLDLDNFKQPNDSHGHAFGDKLLRLVATRMLTAVREVDMVSRHGGDEFVVLLTDVAERGAARTVAEKLIAAISAPADIDGHPVAVSASVGIAIYPDDGDTIETLVKLADGAMYRSKRRGPGGIVFHGAAPDKRGLPPLPHDQGADAGADLERRHAVLREANENLVLAALTAHELKAAAESTRQRQAAFMAAVAEELRNPAAPIRIAAALLGRPGAEAPLLPQVQGMVEQQLTHMSRLVGSLVDAANIDGEGLALHPGPVDMAQVIDESIAALRSTMEARGQQFKLQQPAAALVLRGDAPRLGQVLRNLLDNASKHTHNGGKIGLVVTTSADSLTLTVWDNGIGITPQMLPHVFEPFAQDVHAIGFNGIGLGIGLTIVHKLVQAHGGSLVARSAGIGRGSEFVVTLPLAGG